MKYLIAVDTTENSKYAFRIAKKNFFTEKDHVYILTVAEQASSYPFEDILNFGSTESYEEMNQKLEELYSDLLKRFGRKLTRSSIPHTCLMAKGTIRDVICRQAQDLDADLVILGRRALGAFERTFIGSTSQYCVHNLTCSVVVIPMTAKNIPKEKMKKESVKPAEKVAFESKLEQQEMEKKECKHPECGRQCTMAEMGKLKSKECDHPECGPLCIKIDKGKMAEKMCDHPECSPKECHKICNDPNCKKERCMVHSKSPSEIKRQEEPKSDQPRNWEEYNEEKGPVEMGKMTMEQGKVMEGKTFAEVVESSKQTTESPTERRHQGSPSKEEWKQQAKSGKVGASAETK